LGAQASLCAQRHRGVRSLYCWILLDTMYQEISSGPSWRTL
jgi:hypothetical protein